MLPALLFVVIRFTTLLPSSQAFYCQRPTLKDTYCLGTDRFLIQATVLEEGTVERERGPHFGQNRYTVRVEVVNRDDQDIIQEGSITTVVTDRELYGGQYLYSNRTYFIAGYFYVDVGETLLRTDECEYHICIRGCLWYMYPGAPVPAMPSCDDVRPSPEERSVKKMGLRSQTWQVPALFKMRARSMRKEAVFP